MSVPDNVVGRIGPRPQPTNNCRQEWVRTIIEGYPPARQKLIIVEAAMPELDILTQQEASELLAACGLEAA